MPAYGASRPLRRLPAMVSFLSRKPALSLDGRNRSSCPEAAARNGGRGELGRRLSAMFATSPSRRLRSQCRGRCFVDRPSLIARLRASPCRQARRGGQIRGDERRCLPRYSRNCAFSTSALSGWRFHRLPGTQSRISPCSVGPIGKILPHDCRNIRRMSVSTRLRATVAPRAGCGLWFLRQG